LAAFVSAMQAAAAAHAVPLQLVDAHINDEAFAQAALAQLDRWVQAGVVPAGRLDERAWRP
jgi:uncharacterized protein (UPF0261 family)